ncbi:MAG: hypothetical protein R3D32_12630 [Nitratireductor sp.]
MMIRKMLIGAAIVMAFTGQALSDEMGRVEVNGRMVILNDDNTWQFASDDGSARPANCTEIKSEVVPVSVCLDPEKWTLANLNGAEEHGFRHKEHDLYFLMITEKTVIEKPALKKAAITNAQSAAGLNKVNVLEDDAASVGGYPFGHIVYNTIVDGIDITYANYYTSFPDVGSLQLVIFTGAKEFNGIVPVISEVIAGIDVNQ